MHPPSESWFRRLPGILDIFRPNFPVADQAGFFFAAERAGRRPLEGSHYQTIPPVLLDWQAWPVLVGLVGVSLLLLQKSVQSTGPRLLGFLQQMPAINQIRSFPIFFWSNFLVCLISWLLFERIMSMQFPVFFLCQQWYNKVKFLSKR